MKNESNNTHTPEEKPYLLMLGRFVKVQNASSIIKILVMVTALLLSIYTVMMRSNTMSSKGHIAIINLTGAITAGSVTGDGLKLAHSIDRALKDKNTRAILIKANSGGGSPVQGESLRKAIQSLTLKPINKRVPIYASILDVCASACYSAIVGVDKIYTHENSLVGSIGVRLDGWDIEGALSRFDIKRRVLSSGKYKTLLDPYKSFTEHDEEVIKEKLMLPMHQLFIDAVIEARGTKLNVEHTDLFSGLVWLGRESKKIGLVDEIKSTYEIEMSLKEKHGVTDTKVFNKEPFNVGNLIKSSLTDALSGELTTFDGFNN